MADAVADFADRLRAAAASGSPLRLRGGGTKDFYGGELRGELLDTRAHAGVVSYEPTELVVTARCGTPLAELEAILARERQQLAFEPPHFGDGATLGGCVAAGLSGPRRAAAGAVRDFVLGVRLLDGRGRDLSFGGRVMKNVAGYDVARLAAGSMGILGLILEVSLKVLPQAAAEATRRLEATEAQAIEWANRWAGQPLPVSATAWLDGVLHVRLSGAESALRAGAAVVGGEAMRDADARALWADVREHRHAFFAGDAPLWRLSVRSSAPPLGLPGAGLHEWNGALRWLRSSADVAEVRAAAAAAGGHATRFRGAGPRRDAFTPLAPATERLHRGLKAAFDPAAILNPGRLAAVL